MKKVLVIGCILFLCLAACSAAIFGGYLVYNRFKGSDVQAKLQVDSGTVKVTRGKQTDDVTTTADLFQGDKVTTDDTSMATIVYANNTVSRLNIDTSVEITVLADGGNNINLTQLSGEIWSRVQKVVGNGGYSITGNGVVAAVRGTAFDFNLGDTLHKALVSVTKGTVGVKTSGEEQPVTADNVGAVDADGKFEIKTLAELPLDMDWQTSNELSDQKLDELISKGLSLFSQLSGSTGGLLGNPLSGMDFGSDATWTAENSQTICASAAQVQILLNALSTPATADLVFGANAQPWINVLNLYANDCKDGVMDQQEYTEFRAQLQVVQNQTANQGQ